MFYATQNKPGSSWKVKMEGREVQWTTGPVVFVASQNINSKYYLLQVLIIENPIKCCQYMTASVSWLRSLPGSNCNCYQLQLSICSFRLLLTVFYLVLTLNYVKIHQEMINNLVVLYRQFLYCYNSLKNECTYITMSFHFYIANHDPLDIKDILQVEFNYILNIQLSPFCHLWAAPESRTTLDLCSHHLVSTRELYQHPAYSKWFSHNTDVISVINWDCQTQMSVFSCRDKKPSWSMIWIHFSKQGFWKQFLMILHTYNLYRVCTVIKIKL